MRLYTNKFPILAGGICIHAGGKVEDNSVKIEFEEGKIFKVVGVDQCGIILTCEGRFFGCNADLFAVTFTETEIAV